MGIAKQPQADVSSN